MSYYSIAACVYIVLSSVISSMHMGKIAKTNDDVVSVAKEGAIMFLLWIPVGVWRLFVLAFMIPAIYHVERKTGQRAVFGKGKCNERKR